MPEQILKNKKGKGMGVPGAGTQAVLLALIIYPFSH
jgi:hypothetical protein